MTIKIYDAVMSSLQAAFPAKKHDYLYPAALSITRKIKSLNEWLPIENAPKDRTKILAICATAYSPEANVAWWSDAWWSYRYAPEEKFCQPLHTWFPTHYMPLPKPPK